MKNFLMTLFLVRTLDLISYLRRRRYTFRHTTKYPDGWNKTTDDLDESRIITSDEFAWAEAYERDQLGNVRFPLNGEVYESIDEVEIIYLTHWCAPYTGGGKCILKKNVQVKVEVHERNQEPIAVYALPLNYDNLESEIIPKDDLEATKYGSYSLSIETKVLNNKFKLISA